MSRRLLHPIVLFSAVLLAGAAAASGSDPFENARKEFRAAYDQVDEPTQQRKPDNEDLRTYPLYPYLQAARIRRALADVQGPLGSVDERARKFVKHYEREPVGRGLQRVWLTSLAERKHWAAFLDHYREDLADDALECQSFTARIELDRTQDLEQRVARRWLTPRSLMDCERAFDWLRSRNALTPDLIEQRVRLALEDNNPGFARQIAGQLEPARAAPLLEWAALLENPQRRIDALIAAPDKPVTDAALFAGWARLARRDRDAALERYEKLIRARRIATEAASPYALELAMALAWDRRPEALHFFAKVSPADLDDYALEWRTRAALWAQKWDLAGKSIAAMSDEQRKQARWRYWAARAAENNADPQVARQLYESVLIDDNFYSLMAAARLGQPLAPHLGKVVRDDVQVKEIARLPALVRARELLLCEQRSLANTEWAYAFETLPQHARPQALHLASRWGWHDQAIATATQLRLFNDYELLYPQPYESAVHSASKLSGLQPQLIYSVMRQESLYRPDATSSAGARGLLQLLPETARRTARAWKRPRPTADDLFEPDVAVTLGAAHLRNLLDRFGGQMIVALAAYNAGPNAAARWLPGRALEADVWIENIPYNETRGYVQRILWHQVVFNWLATGEPQRADAWLVRIAPVAESVATADAEG